MFLSRIILSDRKYKALIVQRNPNLIHGTLCSSNPGKKILWRIDHVNRARHLLLLSEEKPDLTGLVSQFGKEGTEEKTLDLSVMISRFIPGSKWIFRIKANPVFRTQSKETGKKTYVDYKNDEARLNWLERRSSINGFSIDTMNITGIETLKFKRKGADVTLASATYDGVLTVTDTILFTKTFMKGLGHGKAYGLGMLTLIPLS